MKRLKIGNVELENPLILAPMAGVTDQPFRLLCREEGCGLAYTEMVSAKRSEERRVGKECRL